MFYDRLKNACEMRGIAISAAVKSVATSSGMVDGWKKGSWPRGDMVLKLAKELRVSTDYLLGRVDSPFVAQGDVGLDERERRLIDGIRSADTKTRNIVFNISMAALSGDGSGGNSASIAPSFSSANERISAHDDRATRPYSKQLQAASKRTGERVWKGVAGKTAAGPPITTVPADDQRVMVPVKYTGEQYFLVQVEGDSMLGIVNDGDFCVLDKRGHFDDGRVVFVQVDGPTDQPEATLKRIYRRPVGKVELRSENRNYPPMIYPADDVQIMGELVAVLRPDCPPMP